MRDEEKAVIVAARLLGRADWYLLTTPGDAGLFLIACAHTLISDPVAKSYVSVDVQQRDGARPDIRALYISVVGWRLPGDPARYRVHGILSKPLP